MKTKLELINYRVDEKAVLEYHLNQMANEGWQLKWFNELFICYEKSEVKLTYYVDYYEDFKMNAPRYASKQLENKNGLYEELGYHFLTNYRYFAVYTSEDKLNAIHTDEEVEERIIKKTQKHYRHANFISNVLPITILILLLIFLWGVDLFDSNLKMGFVILLTVATIYNSISFFGGEKDTSIEMLEKQIKQRSQRLLVKIFIYTCCFIGLSGAVFGQLIVAVLAAAFAGIWTVWMNRLRSKVDDNKKIILMIISFGVYLFMFCFFISFISSHRLNDGKVLFSSELTGIEEVSIIEENESFLLYHNKCRLQEGENYFRYNYYVDKTERLKKSIEKKLLMKNFYYVLTVDGVSLYAPGGAKLESMILVKDNEIIRIDANTELTLDLIEKILHELEWD